MNKITLIAVISICTLVTGCGTTQTTHQNTPTTITAPVVQTPEPSTTAPSLTAETKNQPYSITTATFSQDNIKIQYPQIKGFEDDSKEKAINDLIKNDVLNSQVEAPIKYYQDATNTKVKLTLDLKCQVTMNTHELLSVVYTGEGNIEGSMHPTSSLHTITVDLKTGAKLKLSDFVVIDSNLIEEIKQSKLITNAAVKNGMETSDLITAVQNEVDTALRMGIKLISDDSSFYVTPNSLVVGISISHASGDYALIELPSRYTKK